MIKIDNNIFYISAGETCYIFKIENGVPVHVYFGKRVEPEDDLGALGATGRTPEMSVPTAIIDGVQVSVDFVFADAWVAEDDDGNGKSLIVKMCDKTAGLMANMCYTPHPRGGIYRRVVIKRMVGAKIEIPKVTQSVGYGSADDIDKSKNTGYGFFAACGGERGEAYGFLCANTCGNVAADGRAATCENIDTIIIDDEDVVSPELLCVYSDNGTGGMSRIFHDILREKEEKIAGLSERSAVLFLPKMAIVDIVPAVKAAGELGFGVVALDGGKHALSAVRELSYVCREHGITPGLRVNRDVVDEYSSMHTSLCKRTEDGGYKFDYSEKGTLALYRAVRAKVGQEDIGYVMIDVPEKIPLGAFAIKDLLTEEFDNLRVDFGMKSDEQSKAFTVCYPLCQVRNIISPEPAESFKTRFDAATMGTLGYEFNPLELSEGLKRAVRAQVLAYQDDALTVLHGDIYRSAGYRMAVSKDKSRAYAVCKVDGASRIKLAGLDEHNLYNVYELSKTFSGAALVNCGIALQDAGTYVFHIRQVADY